MQLEVLQESFSKALTTASRFTSARAQLPVLGNILLSGQKNSLSVSATNLEISISINLGAKIKTGGEVTVPSRVITDIINNLGKGTISLKEDKEQLQIKAENFSSTIAGMNSSDFPSIPQTIGKSATKFDAESLKGTLSKVIYSASVDETRPVLTGILLVVKKGEIVFVATDGFRLSQKRIKVKSNLKNQNIILPKNALSELVRMIEDNDVSFLLKDKDNQAVFSFDNTVLATRTLEGEFPNFEKIIPKKSLYKIFVDKEELLRSVKLASVFARESSNTIKISLLKSKVSVAAESQQVGQQKNEIDAKIEGAPGKDFEIAFNFRFLEEFLNSVDGEEVSMSFSNTDSPGIFKDTKDPDFLHLIMPVRLQG